VIHGQFHFYGFIAPHFGHGVGAHQDLYWVSRWVDGQDYGSPPQKRVLYLSIGQLVGLKGIIYCIWSKTEVERDPAPVEMFQLPCHASSRLQYPRHCF